MERAGGVSENKPEAGNEDDRGLLVQVEVVGEPRCIDGGAVCGWSCICFLSFLPASRFTNRSRAVFAFSMKITSNRGDT